ncbi:hypothetical protein PY650_22075 [Rhizobium calliandrae]|uniref:Uncharacterized protein n=1 Tax=Rhizobium calliandrae TaxID=1312182 RepID=A0ABT7KI18_9HYPH|nr:hypothetical protein [Rhizobium calliandrae]MDL2408284.1 hypothetical protein [Rhizobium calliandrae]
MKSPWKFLVRLTSRRPSARETSIGHGADTDASQSDAQEALELPPNRTERSVGSGLDENGSVELAAIDSTEFEPEVDAPVPVDADVQKPALHELRRPNAEASALPLESETSKQPPRIPRTKKPAHANRVQADMAAQNAAVAGDNQIAQSSSRREAFFDEVASLDEEIKQLRSQLAQKLLLQNDQLKKMLERFEIP